MANDPARILLVEDDQGIADPLVRVLEMLGHEAHAVASGLEVGVVSLVMVQPSQWPSWYGVPSAFVAVHT